MATPLSTQERENRATSVNSTDVYQSISNQTAKCDGADRQIKYLHLKAEIDLLLQQLQSMKQNKQIVAEKTLK